MNPILLPSNRPAERFYRGGARISEFRGEAVAAPREPEDWIGSTTTVNGERALGLTMLPDGRVLRDAIERDPVAWLGDEHVARWGADTRLLVKLLDAGQRLPVHAHPHDDFAAAHLGRAHGKAEAWYTLEGGTVHIGLRQDVEAADLAALVERQDATTLLGLLHEVEVATGDVVWVPPGELHAIGAGVLLLELQQPEDLSILLEWGDFAIDGAAVGHLGLGFDLALAAVTRTARSAADLAALISAAPRVRLRLPRGCRRVLPTRTGSRARSRDRRSGILDRDRERRRRRDRRAATSQRLDPARAPRGRSARRDRHGRAARGAPAGALKPESTRILPG
ncbi:carbohydrate kinase [Microbacterium sp. NPDC088619]|uniref:carbohydrate kinase n=1 Tax=Microbacterium sp. NPDC088619 TaxID=3364196 RepID=UPI00382D3F0D